MSKLEALTSPIALSQTLERYGNAPKCAKHKKQRRVGRGAIDSYRCATDLDIPFCARRHIDIVVAGAIVRDIS